jgi:hypothetical protein
VSSETVDTRVAAGLPTQLTSRAQLLVSEGWRRFLSAWDEFRPEAEEFRELDNERVLVIVYWIGRGKTSGLELGHMRTKAVTLFHIRGGKVTRLLLYAEGQRALENLGLAPQPGSPR